MTWFLTITLPLLAAILAAILPNGRRGAGFVLFVATLPALCLGLVVTPGVTAQWLLLESHFDLDTPRRILLLLTSLLWATASLFAESYMRDDARRREFSFYFGTAMAGNFGLLIAADVASFYTFFALMTFASFGLVIHSRTPAARRASRIYLAMAFMGELFLISSLYFAVQAANSMLLADLPSALADASHGSMIFALGLIGFGVKVGAIPLYFWLPLAHPVAPTPASAVLSGAMIKAGLVGWMHLAPVGLVEWTFLGSLMVVMGFTAAIGAVMVGLAQVDPKTNLAYSSISQMGLMTAILGLGVYGGFSADLILPALALYAFNHGTAKALLFMGTALPAKVGGSWRILMWTGLAVGVLSIAGGPLTGGLWTKYLLKTFLSDTSMPGAGLFLVLLTISAIATTLLLSRFLHLLYRIKAPEGNKAPAFLLPWCLLLFAGGWWTMSPLLLPADLLAFVTEGKNLIAFYFNPLTNISALWPIALGGAIMVFTLRMPKFNRWPIRKPLLPPGDLIYPILWIGKLLTKPLRKEIAWLGLRTKSMKSPEQILYHFIENKRTTTISVWADNLLRRWDLVGICFVLFFLTLYYLLK